MANNWKTHYAAKSYETSDSDAAKHWRAKFHERIQRGLASTQATIDQIVNEVPHDALVASNRLEFAPSDSGLVVRFDDKKRGTQVHSLHNNAFQQVVSKVKAGGKYATQLRDGEGAWEHELLAHILNEHHKNMSPSDRLVRSVENEARGVMSGAYKRYHTPALLDDFLGAVTNYGAVALEGVHTDTRVRVRVVLPHVFEPVANEVMLYGLEFSNSDFGRGRYLIRQFIERCWCTNLCEGREGLAKVHHGARLSDEIMYSEQTYKLDTETALSAQKDVVTAMLEPGKVQSLMDAIKAANAEGCTWDQAKGRLKQLTQGEAERVKDLFEGPDTHNLPEGDTNWRMSNAVSFLAQAADIAADRKIDLQHIAGTIARTNMELAA